MTVIGERSGTRSRTGYDFLYAEYSTNGGDSWTQVGTPITRLGRPGGPKKLDLQRHRRRRRARSASATQTDGGVNQAGAFLDNITTKVGQRRSTPRAPRAATPAWTAKGFEALDRHRGDQTAERYYLIENRQYVGYDNTLAGRARTSSTRRTPRPDYVERFPFQNGMLVWLVDQGFTDNNVIDAPGRGLRAAGRRPSRHRSTYPDGVEPEQPT